VPSRPRHREDGNASCERERQQQLIGKMKFNHGIEGMKLVQSSDRLVGNRLG
jgi:hypothetical protein